MTAHRLRRLWLAGALFACAGAWTAQAAVPADSILVTSQDDGSISQIDAGSDEVLARMAVAPGPAGAAVSPDGREVYVTHPDGATIDVVDVASRRVTRSLAYEGEAFGIAAGRGSLYVSDWSRHVVRRLDPITGKPTGSVAVGRSPAGLVVDPRRARLYVADREAGDVSVIDTDAMRVLATIATGAAPFALALSPDGGRLYVANVRSNDLAVIDTGALRRVATVPVGSMPYGVAVSGDGATVLVTNQHGDTLSFVDAKGLAIVATVSVGRYPEGVIVADGRAFVANWFSGDVSVIDLAQRRELARIKVGDGPRNFARLSGSR